MMTLKDRFEAKVDRSAGPDGCWPWTAATLWDGYGVINVRQRPHRNVLAHRLAYSLAHGPIEDGMCVLHSCDNPPCVNPAHLRIGTRKENTGDMVARGRQRYATPWRSSPGSRRLSADGVAIIRAFRRHTWLTLKEIGQRMGFSTVTICSVATGKTWKHLPGAIPVKKDVR